MVIDRERLANSVLRVGELPAYSWVPPGVNNYTAQTFDYAGTPIAERIAAARELLREAGYSAEKPLAFELRYNTGEVHSKVAVAVASMWKEALGVEASSRRSNSNRCCRTSIGAKSTSSAFHGSATTTILTLFSST